MRTVPKYNQNCRSVFRDCVSPLSMERYTKLWIRMINQIERTNITASGLR